jgi:tRNA threonylcarbamoyladenosine biosynthesis protein TsaB
MWILTMETTGPMASVAIINEEGTIWEKVGEKGYNHLTSLIPMTKSLLEENGLAPRDISAVAASVGPGSFTGIRIGVSSARAFSQSMGIPCISIPTLQTFLYNCGEGKESKEGKEGHENHENHEDQTKLVCPVIDARRDQLYGAAFYKGEALVEEAAYSLGDYLERIGSLERKPWKEAIFYGDGISRYGETLDSWGKEMGIGIIFAGEDARYQRARWGALIAKSQWDKGILLSYNELMPRYMRLAEAEQKLKAGTLHV